MSRKATIPTLLILGGLVLGGYLSRDIWKVAWAQRADTAVANKQMRNAEQSRAELLRQEARMDSAAGREELARKNGYLKPGEVRIGQ